MRRKKFKNILYQLINPTLNWNPNEGLLALKWKMKFYFSLNTNDKKKYVDELLFLESSSKIGDTYSWVFPYNFTKNIEINSIIVKIDAEKNMYYVSHLGKRLYFHQGFNTEEKVKIAYYCAAIEQEADSPHRYFSSNFRIEKGSTVLDVGAAEGILGLENIELIDKLYIFEAKSEWIPALEATFAPWKKKVMIVNKFVSNSNHGNNITIDFFNEELSKVDLLKIDVEGAEMLILEGAENVLFKTNKIAICTYHKHNDDLVFKKLLENFGFKTTYSNGYVLFVLNKLKPPYFRRGLIRAVK